MRDEEEGEGCLRSQFSEWNRFWGSAEPSRWVGGERNTARQEKNNDWNNNQTPAASHKT